MKVLLIAPDSKLPNIAMMKLSTFHKKKGDEVGFKVSDPDIVYCSILYTKNGHMADGLKFYYPKAKIIVGGPGHDLKVKLPEEVEKQRPNHSLYPDSEYSFGKVTTGCIRKCSFCVVPKMESTVRFVQRPEDIWKKGTILRLLDDNILALPNAFYMVHDFCLENDVTLHMEYYDIRLLTREIAEALREIRHDTGIWFSYDIKGIEKSVRKGVELLTDAGIKTSSIRFFIYLHNEASIPDAKYRWSVIRELGIDPFIMVNNENRNRKLRRIARRGARPAIYRHLSSDEVFE